MQVITTTDESLAVYRIKMQCHGTIERFNRKYKVSEIHGNAVTLVEVPGDLNEINAKIVQWHHDQGLIQGTTDWAQTYKMFEEFVELVAAQMPDKSPLDIMGTVSTMMINLHADGKIKTVKQCNAFDAKIDAIGDLHVAAENILIRNGVTRVKCLTDVYDIISTRSPERIKSGLVK